MSANTNRATWWWALLGWLVAVVLFFPIYRLGEAVAVQLNLDKAHPFDPEIENAIR